MELTVVTASEQHQIFAEAISTMIEEASKARGTGIAKRSPEYLSQKMKQGKAIIAFAEEQLAGFVYIETFSHRKYVVHSGLIVRTEFRKTGLARQLKKAVFDLSRSKYPNAKVFGITTSLAVMKINSDLGYKPVTFSELTADEAFWQGCQSCVNYDILQRTNRKHCLCTGMLCHPEQPSVKNDFNQRKQVYSRWLRYKRYVLFKQRRQRRKPAAA